MTTLAQILAANEAKRNEEQAAADTAEKNGLLTELAETTEGLDLIVETLTEIMSGVIEARNAIRDIENSPTVSNELLEKLIDKGDDAIMDATENVLDLADGIMSIDGANEVFVDSEVATRGPLVFSITGDGPFPLSDILGKLANGGVIPRQAAE